MKSLVGVRRLDRFRFGNRPIGYFYFFTFTLMINFIHRDFLKNLAKDIFKKISSGMLFATGILLVTFTVWAFQAPTGGDTDPTTAGYTSAGSWISAKLIAVTDTLTTMTGTLDAIKLKTDSITDPTTTLIAIKAKTDTISPDTGWHGCYRKTCEVHNAASCVVTACDAGETDKGSSCPRNGGLWTAQDNPAQSGYGYQGPFGANPAWGYSISYGSKFTADYYVTCERWCCK